MQFKMFESLNVYPVRDGIMHYLNGEKLTVMWGQRGKGSQTSRHAHPHEQIAWLVSGLADCQIGNEPVQRVEAGMVCHIPSGVEHEIWYREDCLIVEIFSPPRADLFPPNAIGA